MKITAFKNLSKIDIAQSNSFNNKRNNINIKLNIKI